MCLPLYGRHAVQEYADLPSGLVSSTWSHSCSLHIHYCGHQHLVKVFTVKLQLLVAVHHEQRQIPKECGIRTSQNMSFCREDFARALSKPNSIAVSLTVSSHCDCVTVFNESPLLSFVQGYLSCTLPGSFQKTSQAILGLQQMNRVSHIMSKCTLVTIASGDYSPPLCANVF